VLQTLEHFGGMPAQGSMLAVPRRFLLATATSARWLIAEQAGEGSRCVQAELGEGTAQGSLRISFCATTMSWRRFAPGFERPH